MLQFIPTALISPFPKTKQTKKHPTSWILSKLSATMEIENYPGKKILHYIY